MRQIEVKKGPDVGADSINKYKSVLSDELLDIWEEYGFGTLFNGYLRIINPKEYQELLNETYARGKVSIPIMTTAFGDFITIEDGQYVGIVKYKNGDFLILAKNFKRFMQNLMDDYFIDKYLDIAKYEEALMLLGRVSSDECYGYMPLLALGGKDSVNNLQKVRLKEHIELITQLVGKIGM